MKITFFALFMSLTAYCFGQSFVFDTTTNYKPMLDKGKYYSQTDFTRIDTLSSWNYYLDTAYHGREIDSVKPIGVLIFWRNKSIDDGFSKKVNKRFWTPYFEFEIFKQTDSLYCYGESFWTRSSSSCSPPDVGGDIVSIKQFIFLNRGVCLNCKRYDTKVDYCRPVINYVFSKIDIAKISSIQTLVHQFVIQSAKFPPKK